MAIKRLSEELEEIAFDMTLDLERQRDIATRIGLGSQSAYVRYMAKFPDFQAKIHAARSAACSILEEQLLYCADDYDKDSARVKMESISRTLKFIDPKRYGDKLNLDVSLQIDIAGSLERAEQRLIDVTSTNVFALPILNKGE